MKKYGGGGGKALYFCGGGGARQFFFQSSGQLAFWENVAFTKMQFFFQMGSVGMKKKILYLEEGSPEKKKKMSYANAMVVALTDKLTITVVVLARS